MLTAAVVNSQAGRRRSVKPSDFLLQWDWRHCGEEQIEKDEAMFKALAVRLKGTVK